LNKLPEKEDGTELYDWAAFIDAESDDELNRVAERNQEVKKAVVKFRELTADERTRDMYERREKARRDEASRMKWSIKQIAKSMLEDGAAPEFIMKHFNLTLEEVESLLVPQ
jgi:hypothetical protein